MTPAERTIDAGAVPAGIEARLRLACAELDRRLRAGEDRRAEEFFAGNPEFETQADLAVELIYTEFVARQELGQQPLAAEFCQRFPRWRASLEEQFEIHALVAKNEEPAGFPLPSGPSPEAGELWLGRYELGAELGRGGMGIVYQARDVQLGRLVAIKVLMAGPHAGEADLDRWRREAESVACLVHPNIVQIHAVGNHDGRPSIVLEFVAGPSLAEHIDGRPQPARAAAALLETLSRAVHFAHERGIVHRDLKPANVLLALRERGDATAWQDGSIAGTRHEPKIADFGLAKRFAGDSGQTKTGAMIGTPSYMAPEQTGVTKYIGPASDVYSLGAILYEMLTGRPPFEGDSALDTARQVVWEEPVPPGRLAGRVPRDLETICLKCLQKEPYKRYATADALAEDLRRFLSGQPILARPVSVWQRTVKWARRRPTAAALVGVSVLAMGLLTVLSLLHAAELRESNRLLKAALDETESQRARATREEAEAKRQADRYREQLNRAARGLYALQLSQAETLWRRDPGRGLVLLEDADACPAELRDFTWRYLHRLCNRRLGTLAAPGASLDWVSFSPDGRLAATAGADRTLRLWDLESFSSPSAVGQPAGDKLPVAEFARIPMSEVWRLPLRVFPATSLPILSAAWADDGQSLTTLEKNGAAVEWDLEAGPKRTTQFNADANIDATCAAFSPAKGTLAIGYPTGAVNICDLASQQVRHALPAHMGAVLCLAFSADGRWLASSGQDRKCHLWDVETGKSRLGLTQTDPALVAAFAPDGKTLATGHNDEKVRLWQVEDGKLMATLEGHLGPVLSLAFSRDGTLASGSGDQSMRIWDVAGRAPRLAITGHAQPVVSLNFSADGRRLISASRDGTARVWDCVEPAPHIELAGHRGRILSLAFSHDGKTLASSSKDMTVKLWDLATGLPRATMERVHRVRGMVFSREDRQLITASEDRSVRLWDPATGEPQGKLDGHKAQLFGLDLSFDGRTLATACDDFSIGLWDLEQRRLRTTLAGHTKNATCVAFSPDGKTLVSGGADQVVRVWDVARERLIQTLTGHTDWVHGLAFSPDGLTLASTSFDATARLWDTRTWKPRHVLRGHTSYVMYVAFSPDGRTLATGAGDRWSAVTGEVKLWDASTGHLRVTLPQQTGPVAFDPDSQRLATGSEQGVIRLWSASDP